MIFAALTAMATAAGCAAVAPIEEIRGQVVEVKAGTLIELTSLSIKDDQGEVWRFEAESYRGFTPSHLREHMALADPVTVRFRRVGELKFIEEVTD